MNILTKYSEFSAAIEFVKAHEVGLALDFVTK